MQEASAKLIEAEKKFQEAGIEAKRLLIYNNKSIKATSDKLDQAEKKF